MNDINKLEIETQERILEKIFRKKLNYDYLGNYKDRENNSNIEDELVLKYLNKHYSEEISKRALFELKKIAHNEAKELYDVNKETYRILKYGVNISNSIDEKKQTVSFIDYDNPYNNDFYVAEEVTIKDDNEKRPDIVIYVNGIAVGVIELKRSTVSINEGIRQNCDNQEEIFIKNFFTTIQFVVAGNDTEGLMYGTTGTPAKYYLKWTEDKNVIGKLHEKILTTMNKDGLMIDNQLISMFHKERILDIINNFIIFDGGIKKLPRYNQYFGVTNARDFSQKRESGIYWHTQGSGKSLSMVWIAKWILANIDDSRIIVFTDRKELDKQIKNVFNDTGEQVHRASSCKDLLNCLNDYTKGRIICSLIHKVGTSIDEESDKEYEEYLKEIENFKKNELDAKGNIFVFVDECHRSQAGKLHDEMKRILLNATFFGFTGTPLLKKNKATTIEKFGRYIHTYKFDQAVKDGVVVDLCYESRNVEQYVGRTDKVDEWFESKTEGLNEFAKNRLKERWGTLQNVTSSYERLEEVVKDIILDFERIPRLREKGNAILVASSIYEACRYWEIFQAKGFKECAVVSSYVPNINDIKGESTGESMISDKKKTYEVYLKMWDKSKYTKLRSENENDDKSICYEDDCIQKFIKEPNRMKLLIVVDRLLTGFDAPSASYLYIDKHMQDHGLFQAICRVNRLDDEKDFGYIVDYKDLFESIEGAVEDYTTGGALENYDKEDITGLLKDRLKLGKEKLDEALRRIKEICEPVENNKETIDYLHYFVSPELSIESDIKNTEPRRIEMYNAVAKLIRSYTNIADEMTKAGYTKEEKEKIKKDIIYYDNVRNEVMKAAGDYIEIKNYDGAMRYMIDNYIKSNESEQQYTLEDTTLLDIIVASGLDKAMDYIPKGTKENKGATALNIEGNIAKTIINNKGLNPRYYSKMSELLNELIEIRRQQTIDYKEYLEKLVELAKKVKKPEESGQYPKRINNIRLRGLYDCLDKNENYTILLYDTLINFVPIDFMDTPMKQRQAKSFIRKYVTDEEKIEEIFNLWKNTRGY